MAVSTKAYEAAAKENQGAESTDTDSSSNDDVQEASYEEK